MDIKDLEEAPSLLIGDSDIVPFVPSVAFAYLFIVQADTRLLALAVISAICGGFVYNTGEKKEEFESTFSGIELDFAVIVFAFPWLLFYPIAAYLLFNSLSIETGVLRVTEIIGTGLLILNSVLSFSWLGSAYGFFRSKMS
ncbi:hypothetical protein [Haloferax sp. DFSO60]|uniref:hypothetical protein n=1 Tax=Haloferax sp. DFSO60 TaxID=3388652 RepID=UPI003979C84D